MSDRNAKLDEVRLEVTQTVHLGDENYISGIAMLPLRIFIGNKVIPEDYKRKYVLQNRTS